MRRSFVSSLALLAMLVLSMASWGAERPADRWIVTFRDHPAAKMAGRPASVIRRLQDELDRNLQVIGTRIAGMRRVEKLWAANAIAVTASNEDLKWISSLPNIEAVFPVKSRKWVDDYQAGEAITPAPRMPRENAWSLVKVRVPEVWEKLHIDGSGVVVGILDSGADVRHPLLAGKVLKFKDFTKKPSSVSTDELGHGSHVAGTICAGNGIGVAPGAKLIVGKIFDAEGSADDESVSRAMQWMMDPDGNPCTNDFPRVINNSWGDSPTPDTDPVAALYFRIIQNWVTMGILPVFSAGNKGPAGSVGRPGCFPNTWAVGSTNADDWGSPFSSVGPSTWGGKTYIKPDISAPGAQILSCKANSSALVLQSGTSMACPHVTGLAALMLQADPKLTADQIRQKVEATAIDLGAPGKDNKFGVGRIDAFACISSLVGGTPVVNLVEGYKSALELETALVGRGSSSPLAGPMTGYLLEAARRLDAGEFRSLQGSFASDPLVGGILREMQRIRTFDLLQK